MPVWKVRITDIDTMQARHPFFKITAYVEADNRKEALERAKGRYCSPKYKVNSASPSEKEADYFFRKPKEQFMHVPGVAEINREIEENRSKLQGEALTVQFKAPLEEKAGDHQHAEDVSLFDTAKPVQGRLF